MEKKEFLLPNKNKFLLLVISFFIFQLSFSQCPIPKDVDVLVGKCASDFPKINSLSATGTNIEWFTTQTGGTALDPNLLLTSGEYWVQQTTDCTSERVLTTVIIYTLELPAIQTNTKICYTTTPTVSDLSSDINILWYENDYEEGSEDLGAPLLPSVELIDGKTYWATKYNFPCEGITRISTTVTLEKAPNAGTDSSYTDCEIDLIDTNLFTLLGDNPDVSGTWTAPDGAAHSGNFVAGTDVEGVYTYTVDGGTICSEDTAIVTVTITVVPAPSITNNNPSFCFVDTKTVGDLIVDDTTATITWYDAATGGNIVDPATELTSSSLWASQTDSDGCESVNRTVVNVTVIDLQIPIGAANQEFCKAYKPTVEKLDATGTNDVLWFENKTDDVSLALDSSLALEDNKTYWASDVDLVNECESNSRLSVLVTLTDVSPPTITTRPQVFCASGFPTIAQLDVSETNIAWYASEIDTTPLNLTTILENGEDYWAVQTNTTSGCESSVRVVVDVTLTDPGTPSISSSINDECLIDKTLLEIDKHVTGINGGTITWYDSYPNGSVLSLAELLIEGETYYAIETDSNGCSSTNPLEITVNLDACDVKIYDGFSPSGDGTNETFKLGNLKDLYPNFSVEFYNRWGNLVYTANASKPDWNGRLKGDGDLAPAGVYYFIIYFNKNSRKPIQRRLYLSR